MLCLDFLLILTGFAESEDLSSGDYSEPTTPNRKTFPNISDEIYQHYHLLQLKLDTHFKQREFERSCASNRSKSPLLILSSHCSLRTPDLFRCPTGQQQRQAQQRGAFAHTAVAQ